MAAGRSNSVAALVLAAAALLLTCIFGFLSFTPGVSPDVAGFLQLGFFGGVIATVGSFGAYFFLARRSNSSGKSTKFDRQLDQRKAALAAVPVGLGAVLVGGCWYIIKSFGEGGAKIVTPPGTETFANIDTIGIAAFLGFGSMYILGATYLAIRAERSAIRSARDDAEVNDS